MPNLSKKTIDLLSDFLAHTEFARKHLWEIDLIVNPVAGAFRRPDKAHFLCHHFQKFLKALKSESSPLGQVAVHPTTGAGTEYDLVNLILSRHRKGQKRLVIVAGGDGTANHTLTAFVQAAPSTREGIVYFRIPLGTGNDYADAPDLPTMFQILGGAYTLANPPYLEFKVDGRPRGFVFNIGSIGLDAWVVMLNEKLRKVLPGNFYKLAVDLSGFFYKGSAKPGPLTAEYYLKGKLVGRTEGDFLLTAFAPEGKRVYGGGIKVLPGVENLCRISPVSLWTFICLKNNFYKGLHVDKPFATMLNFDRAVFHSPSRLAAQYDGETFWLDAGDYPYEVRVVPGDLQFLRPLTAE